MNKLSALMKPDLKCGKNYAATQNVSRSVAREKSNLPRETRSCFQQLDLQIEEIDSDGTAECAYIFRMAGRNIVYSNETCVLGAECRVRRSGIEDSDDNRVLIAVEEPHLSGGVNSV